MAASENTKQGIAAPAKIPAPLLAWANQQTQQIPRDIDQWDATSTSAYIALRECIRRSSKRAGAIATLFLRMRMVRNNAAAAAALSFADPSTLANQLISTAKANAHLSAEKLAALRALDVDKSSVKAILSGEL